MAFFPDVKKGDAFQPNALLSNNVRHIVNSLNGFCAGALPAIGGMIRIQIYNATGAKLTAETAVNFSDGTLCDNAVPAVEFYDAKKPWGVIVNNLDEMQIGSCIVCGPAHVSMTGEGDYAEPDPENPSKFRRGSNGVPVIYVSDDNDGIILLGAISPDEYNGPFALSYDADEDKVCVSAGYLNRNGEWLDVPSASFDPESGTVCVCTTLDENGTWTEPEIKVTTPGQFAYPVGSCLVDGDSVSVSSYRVPVAIFLVSDICSTAT